MKIKRAITISTLFLLICLMFVQDCAVAKNNRHHKKGSQYRYTTKKDQLRRLQIESESETLSVPTPELLEEVSEPEPELAPKTTTGEKTSTSSPSENTKSDEEETLDG